MISQLFRQNAAAVETLALAASLDPEAVLADESSTQRLHHAAVQVFLAANILCDCVRQGRPAPEAAALLDELQLSAPADLAHGMAVMFADCLAIEDDSMEDDRLTQYAENLAHHIPFYSLPAIAA